jgi:FkbM family methyltransferase
MPVDPAFPRPAPRNDPWGPATYWDCSGNRKIRQVYKAYLGRRPAGTFVDVGANWGFHTAVFAAAGYACVGFEPQSICCAFIERVADLNRFTRVSVVPQGVGAVCKTGVPFYESEVEAFSSLDERHVASFHRSWTPRLIDITTLDAYCELHQVTPTFIKIDAEGFETDIITGASSVLGRWRPDLLIEISAPEQKQRVLWDALHPLGYRCYSIVRSLGGRYPAFPFVRIADVDAFLDAAREVPTETFQGDRDFVFLQPDSDVLAAVARPSAISSPSA